MKWIDQNGRLFSKISVVDLLVIVVVAALAAALNFKGGQTHTSTASAQQDITYQIKVSGARTFMTDVVRVGDKLYDPDRDSGGALGEIIDISVTTPGTRLVEMGDGTCGIVPMEDSVDLLLTIRGKGIVQNKHCLINRVYELGVNSSRTFCTPYAQFVATVTLIQQ